MADETRATRPHDPSGAWDLLPGYALDALDDLERRTVERLLESDADARRALDEYREVVASFVVEAEPPAELRASVLRQVQDTPQLPAPGEPAGRTHAQTPTGSAAEPDAARAAGPTAAPGPVAPASGPAAPASGAADDVVVPLGSRTRRRWGLAVTAVAAAAAIAVPTTIAVQVTADRDRLREQNETVAEMLADPDSSIVRAAVEGGGEASMLIADGDMFFRADGLPEPADGRAYQLWVVGADGGVSSAGVLTLRSGATTSLVRGSEGVGLAVSVEPEGGSEQPTTTPVVVLSA